MTHVDWNPFPKEKPTREDAYLTTIIVKGEKYVIKNYWLSNGGIGRWSEWDWDNRVIAWAEMPEPYKAKKRNEYV